MVYNPRSFIPKHSTHSSQIEKTLMKYYAISPLTHVLLLYNIYLWSILYFISNSFKKICGREENLKKSSLKLFFFLPFMTWENDINNMLHLNCCYKIQKLNQIIYHQNCCINIVEQKKIIKKSLKHVNPNSTTRLNQSVFFN